MDGIHDDTLTHRRVLDTRNHLGEIKDNLCWTVRDDSKIAIGSLGHIRIYIQLKIGGFLFGIVVCTHDDVHLESKSLHGMCRDLLG